MSTDIHALSGAYALDALDAEERADFERHLADCPACRAEVDSLREAAAELAVLTEVAPPASLRARVLADVATVRPLPPVVARRGRGRRWMPLLAAAAAVVLVGGGLAWQPWRDDNRPPALSAVERVAQAPDAQRIRTDVPGGGSVTIYRSSAQKRVAIVAENLPDPPKGHVYEMWLQDDQGAMKPAGLIPSGGAAAEMVLSGASATAATGAGMTVEPAGGSSAPTTDPLMVVEFRTA